MTRIQSYWNDLPAEEKANTLTHLIPWLLTLIIAWPLLDLSVRSDSPVRNSLGTALFLIGMMLMFGSSTLYHYVMAPVHKARLRIFDHISIYVMIAGSYSLLCMSVVGGWLGWSIFIFLWACVIAGIVGKLVALGKNPKLSLIMYLAMGWVALLMIIPLWKQLPHVAFMWIVLEGVFYTTGAYFFRLDETRAYYHAIWHVFIILGATSHTIATWLVLCQ